MNVQFLKGLSSVFKAEGFSPVATTFYYLTDTQELYLGSKLLSNEVSLAEFESLKERVTNLETWKGQIDEWKNTLPEYVLKTVYDQHLLDQAEVDKGQSEKIAELEETVQGIITVGGEANLVNDVTVDGTSVVVDKVAQLKKLAGKDTVATADIDNDAVTADKLADAINEDIAKGVAAKAVTDTIGDYVLKSEAPGYADIWTETEHNAFVEANKAVLNSGITADKVELYDETKERLDTFLGTVTPDGSQDIIDTLTEINNYVGEHGEEFAALSGRVTKVEDGTTVVGKANADKDGNEFSATYAKKDDISGDIAKGVEAHGWGNHASEGYLKAADISGKADRSELNAYLTIDAHNNFVNGNAVLQSGINADKVALIDDGVAAKAVTDTLKSAAFVEASEFETSGTAAGLIGTAASVEGGPTGLYAAIQGSTSNTVKDCVDSINSIMGVLTWGEIK